MRQIFLLLVPAAAITLALATPIVRLVYQRGAFDAESTKLVSEALFWFSFSLPFAGVNLLLTRTFFSLQRPWLPTALAAGEPRRQRRRLAALYKPLGIAGLVIGTAVASLVMTIGQAVVLRRRVAARSRSSRRCDAVLVMAAAAALLGCVACDRLVRARQPARALAARPDHLGRAAGSPPARWIYGDADAPRCAIHEAEQIQQLIRSRLAR